MAGWWSRLFAGRWARCLAPALALWPAPVLPAATTPPPGPWAIKMAAARAAAQAAPATDPGHQPWVALADEFPVEEDWVRQDSGDGLAGWARAADPTALVRRMIGDVLATPGFDAAALRNEFSALAKAGPAAGDARWLDLYARACEARRAMRLRTVLAAAPRIVFTKHATIRPSFFAYTEGQSDAQAECHFLPGSELCLLELASTRGTTRTLLADPGGAIRDPAVSWDGRQILFAWKKSLRDDDYHLYEMEVASGRIRQITEGLGFADLEPAYLPNGDIVFSSTRCVQTVDCWWTEVSNLYTCDPQGRFLRRLGFDQVHTVFPSVLADGRVVYTRWDYNDRGQVFPQGLFQMNPDGTGQTEFYGNNSWFPTTIAHARGIPGTGKVAAILCGHHSSQAGKLAVIDPSLGRQENSGVQLVAPVRETPAERIDSYGQQGELWQYPYPLNQREMVVTYAPQGWDPPGRRGDAAFALYWMDIDGKRELLAADPRTACQQPVPLVPRPRPPVRPSLVDYRQDTGTCYVQDVYHGPGLEGVERGSVRKLRVVALGFRAAGIGHNGSGGPGGGALISTPVAVGNGTWDQKIVLGEAKVHADGSAFFRVPARTPFYFQAIDASGHAAQSMRSWTTLQPGENQSCVGCHESKNSSPQLADGRSSLALEAGAQALQPFHGPPRGFSFPKEIQPILDQHCVRCHNDRDRRPPPDRLAWLGTREADPDWSRRPDRREHAAEVAARTRAQPAPAPAAVVPAFSLLGAETVDAQAKRRWSDAYLNLTAATTKDPAAGNYVGTYDGRIVNWPGSQSVPAPLPPYTAGACRSELLPLLEAGHAGTRLSPDELATIACWIDLYVPYCGDYTEAAAWTEEEHAKYQRYADKRQRMAEMERQNLTGHAAAQQGH